MGRTFERIILLIDIFKNLILIKTIYFIYPFQMLLNYKFFSIEFNLISHLNLYFIFLFFIQTSNRCSVILRITANSVQCAQPVLAVRHHSISTHFHWL